MEKLQAGNQRFMAGHSLNRNLLKQVKETSKGQYPFATVVSCLDARTSSELIFDQGIGDIFNARVAGNIVNSDILGSLEFASKAAGSKVIAVIGHTKCGAIKGACDHVKLGNLTGLLDKIEPAVAATATSKGEDRSSKNSEFVDRVAETNVRQTIANIRNNSAVLRQMEQAGQISIVGGMYDIGTGKVDFLK
jgi:carbonic anhydrase